MTDTEKLKEMADLLRQTADERMNESLQLFKYAIQLDVYAEHAQESDKAGLVRKAVESCPEVFGRN